MMRPTILKSDIGETIVYEWDCPSCGAGNEEWDNEPTEEYELHCDSCGMSVKVI